MNATHPMGKVLTEITITNRSDQSASPRGFIPAEEVRSVTVQDALIDTGATTLCWPTDVIQTGIRTAESSASGY